MEFWSSIGSASPDVDEFLIYEAASPYLISAVEISFYQAMYQLGSPCYAPERVRISIGMHADQFEYCTGEIPVSNTPLVQRVDIHPIMVYGRVIRVDLIGKVQRQPDDNLFYSCVRYFSASGISLLSFSKSADVGHIGYRLSRQLAAIFKVDLSSASDPEDSAELEGTRRNSAELSRTSEELGRNSAELGLNSAELSGT
jgi:hypothetical protein